MKEIAYYFLQYNLLYFGGHGLPEVVIYIFLCVVTS